MTDITIPNVGESVSEVTIAQWFKAVGDTVKKDEPLVELETDKAAQELVSPEDGVLEEILVAEGENAEVGKLIARLGSGSGAAKPKPAEAASAAKAPAPASNGASINIDVPNVGESVSEVTIAVWMKQPGDAVAKDEAIVELVEKQGVKSYRGSEEDVLDRFYQSVKDLNPDWVVRLTSDCPLIDPQLIDEVIQQVIDSGVDYGSNVLECTYPDGQDIEVFTFSSLEKAWNEAGLGSEREHVTPYIYKNSNFNKKHLFNSLSITNEINYSNVRLTVDTIEDFNVIEAILSKLGTDRGWEEYAHIYKNDELIHNLNKEIKRNEGYTKSLKEDGE